MIELVLSAIPLLLLVASLLFGLYPGHRTAMRLAERIASRAGTGPDAASADSPRPVRPPSHAVQGGLLLAFSLSGRAPPASA